MASDAEREAVLVTGGAGYIGSHAARALVGAGRRAVVVDNLSMGHREAVRWCDLVAADLHDEEAMRRTIRQYGVSAVMHFAALASVGLSVADPAAYYRENVEGTLSLLRAMRAEGVSRLVFSSTAAVFGEPIDTPITEDHPTRPINPYGETKLVIERALAHYERAYGLHSVTLRYFNAAGADPEGILGEDHRPEEHVLPIAIDAALGRGQLEVFGGDYPTPDGTCLRDYVHVTDLAQAHLLALARLESGAGSAVYNLGNGRPFSVRDVIRAVERVTGRTVPWSLGGRRPGDPAVLFASSARIRSDLGWSPAISSLEDIVDTAYRWRLAHPAGYGGEDSR
ncbi:MAG TPA: UDP-glucose 4-epimerase GalE [Vicinamibacterales bacterium]|nr:UDP-glucose 4-epimerase GalE [Vicinamibacterales bacterium]HPW20767.1 UDP-glucose 4-epimerase GalE [Vicinamibacterales bacterium]